MAKPGLTDAIQDYLREIYKLGADGGRVSVTALAKRQGVSPASASAMVKKLAALELAVHQPYRGITLTQDGEKVALEVIRHHRLLELYLAETLGVDVNEVHGKRNDSSTRCRKSSRSASTRRSDSRRTIRTGTRSRMRT